MIATHPFMSPSLGDKRHCEVCGWLESEHAPELAATKGTEATPRPWGIEETSSRIYIGPMRSDGIKVNEIALSIDIDGITKPESLAARLANAALIVKCVNQSAAFEALLEACKGLLICIGSFAHTGTYPTPDEPEIVKARAALALAETTP